MLEAAYKCHPQPALAYLRPPRSINSAQSPSWANKELPLPRPVPLMLPKLLVFVVVVVFVCF